MKLFDNGLTLLSAGLDARLRRHEILSGNVANLDTPGFRPLDLDPTHETVRTFAEHLRRTEPPATLPREGTGPRVERAPMLPLGAAPAGGADPALVEMPGTPAGLDGNSVDLDRTMAAMAENGIEYGAIAKALQRRLGILRYVVSDGNA